MQCVKLRVLIKMKGMSTVWALKGAVPFPYAKNHIFKKAYWSTNSSPFPFWTDWPRIYRSYFWAKSFLTEGIVEARTHKHRAIWCPFVREQGCPPFLNLVLPMLTQEMEACFQCSNYTQDLCCYLCC